MIAQSSAFAYGQRVRLIPCDRIEARVTNIHWYPHGYEYDVRYFENADAKTARVFADEIEAI